MSPLPIKPFHVRSAVVFLPWESCTQKALLHTALGEGKRICYHHGGGQVWGTSPITSPSKRQEQPPQPCSWAGHEAPTRTEPWPWASGHQPSPRKMAHSSIPSFRSLLPSKRHHRWPCQVDFQPLFSCKGHIPVPPMAKTRTSDWQSRAFAAAGVMLAVTAQPGKVRTMTALVPSTPPWHLPAHDWLCPHPLPLSLCFA